ncbi:uncharacterized protein LOC135198703 [Macrobrachium nipponense]|uniref:uncharacterized protein LOC135198703 n=1 Tax=Macrobrachium nipponense TaxID=159736 RepID=UPI0030C83A93
MLPFDSIPTSIRRCIHYFIFTTAAIIVAVGLLIMQRKKGKVGDYIVVTGVVVLMIGILLLSKEYRGRGAPSLPTRTQASTEQQSQPPRNDPPPSYSDTWRESYLQDQEKKAELDPPPPAYRESWSKGLWKKYFQSGRIGCDNHLCELNASTLPQDVENTASLPHSQTGQCFPRSFIPPRKRVRAADNSRSSPTCRRGISDFCCVLGEQSPWFGKEGILREHIYRVGEFGKSSTALLFRYSTLFDV